MVWSDLRARSMLHGVRSGHCSPSTTTVAPLGSELTGMDCTAPLVNVAQPVMPTIGDNVAATRTTDAILFANIAFIGFSL
jgi:hypothetical protein